MKTTEKILFCFFLLIISSCTKLYMYSYGVRNPKVENQQSIIKYLNTNNIDVNNNYALKDTAELYSFFKSKIGTPEILFYDHNGYLMQYKDAKKCNGQNDSLINFLNPQNVIKIDSTNNIFDYLTRLKTLDGQSVNINDFKNQDYYLIIYWAKWLGKMNKSKIVDWEKSLAHKQDLKIKTIKVTTDYMNFWKIDKKEMIKVYTHTSKASAEKRQAE